MRKVLIVPVAAVLLWATVAAGPAAQAAAPPHTVYGGGLTPGDTVTATVSGVSCGTATVDANGEWVLSVLDGAPCNPSEGDTIAFTVNGKSTSETESWHPGGLPGDVANGVALIATSGNTGPALAAFANSPKLVRGVNLVVFNGGDVDVILGAAPTARSIWVSSGGELVGYIPGALAIANRAFDTTFPGGAVAGGTALLILMP